MILDLGNPHFEGRDQSKWGAHVRLAPKRMTNIMATLIWRAQNIHQVRLN